MVKNISVTQSLVSHLVFCNFHGDSNLFSYQIRKKIGKNIFEIR